MLITIAVLALLSLSSPIYAVLSIGSYFGVILLHELGHACIVRWYGYRVEAVRVAILHGSCEYSSAGYEWEEVLIAWGGFAAQICVAVPVLTISAVLGAREIAYFGPIVAFLGYFNLLVALVNLAPSPEFDGKVAWRIVPLLWQQRKAKRDARKLLGVVGKRK